MNPSDFNIVAFKLAHGKNSTAAEFRSSISRSYYAVFHVGAEILNDIGIKVDTGPKGHHDVIDKLNHTNDKELKFVGSQLNDLYSARLQADYHLNNADIENPDKAKAVVKQAANLIARVDGCKKGEPSRKDNAAKCIKEWQEKLKPSPSK